jgi:hypothetical protein
VTDTWVASARASVRATNTLVDETRARLVARRSRLHVVFQADEWMGKPAPPSPSRP